MHQKWASIMRRRRSCLLAIRLSHQSPLANVHLSVLKTFCILAVYMSMQADTDVDIRAGLGKAASILHRLHSICASHSISNTTKVRPYSSIVLSTALDACETWTSTARIRNTLDAFHRRCIHKLGQDRIANEESMKRARMHDLSEMVKTRILSLAGHVLRTPESRPASVALSWLPETGGRLQKTWRLAFSEDLQELEISWRGAKRV